MRGLKLLTRMRLDLRHLQEITSRTGQILFALVTLNLSQQYTFTYFAIQRMELKYSLANMDHNLISLQDHFLTKILLFGNPQIEKVNSVRIF